MYNLFINDGSLRYCVVANIWYSIFLFREYYFPMTAVAATDKTDSVRHLFYVTCNRPSANIERNCQFIHSDIRIILYCVINYIR